MFNFALLQRLKMNYLVKSWTIGTTKVWELRLVLHSVCMPHSKVSCDDCIKLIFTSIRSLARCPSRNNLVLLFRADENWKTFCWEHAGASLNSVLLNATQIGFYCRSKMQASAWSCGETFNKASSYLEEHMACSFAWNQPKKLPGMDSALFLLIYLCWQNFQKAIESLL